MDLATAESALRTLKHRPKVPQGAVETSATLLALVAQQKPTTPDATTNDDENAPPLNTAASSASGSHPQQRELMERGLTTLLVFGKERWEPLAVFAVVVRDVLNNRYTPVLTKNPSRTKNDQDAPFSRGFLEDVVASVVRDFLEHWEPRVRMSVARLIGALARFDLVWVTKTFTPLVVESVQCNLTRSPDFEETGFDEFDDNVSMNGMESPTAGGSQAGTPRTPSTPHRLDDVSGWKALESSLSAFKYILRGANDQFLTANDGVFQFLTPEIWKMISTTAVFHINRHVRVVGLDILSAFCDVAPVGFLETHQETITEPLSKCVVRGLQDNWSQVRYAACITTRNFLTKLSEPARDDYFGVLVPRICLNRYYVAERVQKHSQETWRLLMGDRGREIVGKYANEIVAYYIEMTNHCVREAACHCIAELATKVDKHAVRPHVPRLLEALLYSFRDNSWLVRDAACLASSQFVLAFPEESREALDQLYELWIDHLSDEIWSVREDAAIALGNVMRAYGQPAVDRVSQLAAEYLDRAKTQPAMSQHDHDEHCKSLKTHTSKQAFSCCSFEPVNDERHEHREKQPWEHTDGAIYLVRELCGVAPQAAIALLPQVADVAILRHFPQTATLQETVWKQLPLMCDALGKRVFKQYLELFLDPLVFTIQGSNRLAKFAARDCVAQLSAQIGPNIFLGRLQANATWLEVIAPVVPMTQGSLY